MKNICHQLDVLFRGRARRWVALFAGIFEMVWFSGVSYGYNALLPAYKELKVFREYCNGSDCTQQQKMFSYAFIVSVVAQMCLIPLAGVMMDRIGLRVSKLVCVTIISIGMLMFGFTGSQTGPLLFVGMILVAFASLASLFCNHQISSQFPYNRGLVISLLSGGYDSSTAIFFIFSQTYPQIPLLTSFIILACGCFIYGSIMALFFLTQYSKDMATIDGRGIEVSEYPLQSTEESTALNKDEEDLEDRINRVILERYPNTKSCFRSWPFALVSMWFMLGLLRFSYFFSQLSSQLELAFNRDQAIVNNLLSISSAVSMCGLFAAPITGTIMDVSKKAYRKVMKRRIVSSPGSITDRQLYWIHLRSMAPATTVMASVTLILSCLLFIPGQQWVFYVVFILHLFLRSLLFSTAATMTMLAFPVVHFGTVFGVVNLVAGALSLLQYAFLELTATVANALCVVIGALMFIPPLVLFIYNG